MAKEQGNGGGGSFWAGVMLGAIVGVVAAMFLTPKRGEEWRQEVMRRKDEMTSAAGEMADQARETMEEQRSRLQQAVDEARTASAETRDEMMNRYRQEAEGRTGG